MHHIRNPNRGQLAGAQQLGQRHRISAIGLDPVARAFRDQRRRHHDTGVTKRHELAIEPVAGGPGLVTEMQLVVLTGELRDQLSHCFRRVGDLPQIPHLAVPPPFRHRHGVLELRAIERNESFPISVHRSFLCAKAGSARPSNPRANSHSRTGHLAQRTYGLGRRCRAAHMPTA